MKYNKTLWLLLRVGIGWIFFYAGLSKVLDPEWTALGYLTNAQSFQSFYAWLATPEILSIVNLFNKWGLILIGASLILGVFVRIAGWAGAIVMILYYIPVLHFPYAGDHSYLIDDHIIYALVLLLLATRQREEHWSIRRLFKRK